MSGVTVPTMITSTSLGLDAARSEAFFRRLSADIAHALARGQHVPLADAGTLHDPLVVGVHHFFEVFDWSALGEERRFRARVILARRPTTGRTVRLNAFLLAAPIGDVSAGNKPSCGGERVESARRLSQKRRRADHCAAAPKKYRVTYCARTSPLPLLPSGPGGVGGITSRRTRH